MQRRDDEATATATESDAMLAARLQREEEAAAAALADADIIEIDEETGNLSITTEVSAKSKMKSTIPKTNGKCLIQLVE